MDRVTDRGDGRFQDRAGAAGCVAWVLDGASPVFQEHLLGSHADAVWLVERLDQELRALAGEPEPLEKLVAQAIRHTAERAADDWEAEPEIPPSAALGVVRRISDRTEYLVLADVSVILRTGAGVEEITDDSVDRGNTAAREAMKRLLDEGRPFDEVKKQIDPLLAERRRCHMNHDGGYWVASLDEHAVTHALTGTVEDVREVVLATDGFMRVLRPFGLVPGVEALFEPRPTMTELAHKIRVAEKADADTRRYPRWTVHDDICAQRLRWAR